MLCELCTVYALCQRYTRQLLLKLSIKRVVSLIFFGILTLDRADILFYVAGKEDFYYW